MKCSILNVSNSIHTEQIYTGFSILSQSNKIEANIVRSQYADTIKHQNIPFLKVTIDKRINIIYDLADSQELVAPNEMLEDVHFYFKRSFNTNQAYNFGEIQFYPLGFNYLVYNPNWRFLHPRLRFEANYTKKVELFFRQNTLLSKIMNINNGLCNCNIRKLELAPTEFTEPGIIFMTRAWPESRAKTDIKKEHRFEINQMRANCIRALKKEFKEYFTGGFYVDEYSKKSFPDCLIADNKLTQKGHYLEMVKKTPICIATTGLEWSTGWKMGEYIALSRAILSEEIFNKVPGEFIDGRNYLQFSSTEHCVEQATKLFQNKNYCLEIMNNNQYYYQHFLRPDVLVWNTLEIIKKTNF